MKATHLFNTLSLQGVERKLKDVTEMPMFNIYLQEQN